MHLDHFIKLLGVLPDSSPRQSESPRRAAITRRIVIAAGFATLFSSVWQPGEIQIVWAAGNYSTVVGSDLPVGYWRLDETTSTTAADSSSGHANPLTYQGGYTLAVQPGAISGDPDPGVGLNGSTGTVTAAKAATTSTTNWSLEAWVNPSTLPQAGVVAYNGQIGSDGYGFAIGSTNGSSLSSGSHLIGILGSVTMFDSGFNFSTPNTWYHVVMTRDTSTTRLYANAVPQTTTSTQTPVAPGTRFSLGAGFTSSSVQMFSFAGSLDEAASYNSLLSAARVLAHYTEGASPQSAFGNWLSLSPTSPPSARFEPAMGWDSAHSKVVLFGGQGSTGSAIQETWTWDGTSWTKLSPSTQPSARWGAQLVYDTALGKMVLFGGTGKKALSDTWTWDGTTWAQLTPSTNPPARLEYGFAYDAANSVVVMFGGNTGSAALQDTYTFNGTNWTLQSPTAKPTIRSQVAMTYNTAANNTVLFGGVNGSTYNAETWTWDGTNWTQKAPSGSPSARSNSGLAYNALTSTVVLVGGANGSTYFGDTWTWDGTNWTQQLPANTPVVRAGTGFAYNGVIGADSLFGGLSGSTYRNDTMAWATPPGAPTSVTATAGNTQATVSWTAPASGGSALTGYTVTSYVGSAPGNATTASAPPVTVTGLTNGTTYTFKVYASSAIGKGAVSSSNAVTPASTPGAPTNLVAAPGSAQASVSWTAPGSGGSPITGYTVTPYDNGTAGTPQNVGASTTSATFSSLINGHSEYFQVYATNAIGNGPSSTSNTVTVGAPTAPGNVQATGGANQATVTWTASSANASAITGYTVVAYIGTQASTRVNTGPSATQATLYGLQGQTAYTFQVTAANSYGSSPAGVSNAVTPTGAGSTYETTVAGDNPSAYWRLDDPSGSIATDVTGSYNGTYTGTVTLSQTGLIPSDPDPSITCDGSTGYVATTNSIPALQGDNTRSVEMWFSTTNWYGQVLFDSGTDGTAGAAFRIGITQQGGLGGSPPANTPGLYVAFGNDDVYLPGLYLADGQTHHIVITLSVKTLYVYVDGRTPQGYFYTGTWNTTLFSQPFTLPTAPNTASNPVWIGHGRNNLWSGRSYFGGTIDEVAVYPTALSATQVSNHEQAAQIILSAPTISSVTGGANQVTINWSDSSNTRAFPGFVVTAYSGTTPAVSKAVAPSANTATLTGLSGSASYTVQISLSNAFGLVSTTSSSVTATGSTSTYASTVETTTPQPVFYYRLSDSGTTIVADSSGFGQTGAYVGSPNFGVAGALANDNDPGVTLGSAYIVYSGQNIPSGKSARSVELWVKTTSTAWNQQLVSWGDGSGFGTQWDVRYNGGSQIGIGVYASGTNPYVNLPYSISNGQWHQVVVTFDGASTITVYVDGNRAGTFGYGSINTTKTGVYIGSGFGNATNNPFQGTLDEIAVYSGALSSSQVMAHFLASGNSQPTPPATVTATAGTNSATVTWTAAPTNPYPVLGYMVTAYNGTLVAGSQATGPSATSATISGLQGGVAYTFAVSAINNFGFGSSTSSSSVTPTGASSTYASSVIGTGPSGNGPVVYYRLGDSSSSPYMADSSGNNGWGVYGSGATLGTGGAMPNDPDTSFSGSAYWGTGNGLPSGNTSRTVELWLKTTSTANMVLVDFGNYNSGATAFTVQITNGYRIWINLNNQTNPAINSPYNLANGQWHYVVLTWNGSVFTLYVDGTSAGTWSNAGIATTAWVMSVGVGNNGGAPFSGNLDEIAIYGRALSQSEITAHFQASGNSQPAAPPAGSVGATAGQNQVTVAWQSVTNPSPVTGYLVTAYSGSLEQESVVVSAGVQSVVMSGLPGGISYTFNVAGINNFGIGASTTSPAVTPTGSSTTYLSTVLGSGAIAYYRLDDSAGIAADSSGNNLMGSYFGTYTQRVPGGLASDFDPAVSVTSGGLQVNQISSFPLGASARTIEIWFNTSTTSTQVLASYGDQNAGGNLFQLQILSGGTQLNLQTTTTNWAFTTPYNVTNGQWHLADVVYDGANLTMYVDGTSLGSQAAGLNTDVGTVFFSGSFTGSLDELSIYARALSAADVSNHWSAAGAGVPAAPTNVTATPSANSAVVKWTPPTPRGAPVTSFTITPHISGGPALASMSVTGSTTSANVPNLPGGMSISFAVAALNKYGVGPAASSPIVSIGGTLSAPGMDRFLAIATGGNPAYGIYYEGWVSNAAIPKASLSQWTIEGWVWAIGTKGTASSNMAWGLLSSTSFVNPGNNHVTIPDANTPQAGIDFNLGNMHGINNCCDISFVWPHNGATGYGVGGRATPSNLSSLIQGGSPVYIALDYDGTTVRGYINGAQAFTPVVDSAAIPADAAAGFMDRALLGQGAFDGFRVSNIARYTGTSFNVPTADLPSDTNTLVNYNFDNYPVGKQPSILLTPFNPWSPVGGGDWPDSSSNHNDASYIAVTYPWVAGWFANSALLFQPFELTPGITPGELADECKGVNTGSGNFCTRSTDLSIGGRGPYLSLQRTYNSFGANNPAGPFGFGWSSSYTASLTIDGSGNVTVNDPLGGNEFFPLVNGIFTTPSYVSTTLVLSGGVYTLTDKHGGQLIFNSTGQLIQEVDRNLYTTTLTYVSGKLTTVTDPSGRKLNFVYGSNGLVSSVGDGSRTVTYGYDTNLNLTSVTDVLGGVTSFTYDSSHRMLTEIDPVCNTTSGCKGLRNIYDTNGRVSQQTDPVGNTSSFTYTVAWPLFTTSVTDPLGHQNIYDYALGMPLDVTQAANTSLAATITYTYDPASLGIASVTNPNSETTSATYDSKSNPLTSTDSLGHTTTYTYNSFGEPLTVTDPMGVTTTNTYDANGNLLTTSTPLVGSGTSQTTTYTYGDPGHRGDITAQTDPTNRTVTYTYDVYGNRASSTDPLGNKTTYVYDPLGRMTSTVSPLGNVNGGNPAAYTTTKTYNAAGKVLTSTDPLGHQTVNVYDIGDHLIRTTDAVGNVTTYTYDLDGRPTATTIGFGTPQAATNQTTYDADGHILSQVDGLNHTMAVYTYDALNREATIADGLRRTTTYGYDADGRLTSLVNPLNQTTTYVRDSGGRVTGVMYSDGVTAPVSYTYDADGRVLTIVDGTGTTTNVWDSLNRLTQQTDGAGHTVAYTYDLAGRVTSLAYPGGTCTTPANLCVTRQYDTAGRLSSVKDWLSNQTTFAYDANSNLTGTTYQNGVVATWTFDPADELTGIADVHGTNSVLNLTYNRDKNGQLTGENSASYSYNALNQLILGPSALAYSYDLAGRLAQTVAGSTTTNYNYDSSDQLNSTAVVGGSSTSYTYDAAGRRIASGSTSLTWDQRGNLVSFGSANTYTYNGSGLRTSKTVSAQSEAFVWDSADGAALLLQDGSTFYVTGSGGMPLEQITGSTVYYYHQDQLGSTRAVTDSTGAIAATYTYDAYGNISSQTGQVTNPFLFAGQYRDAESGLYHLRARYYDPATGQFISRDPKLSKTWAPYAYAANNPLNLTDPSGLDFDPLGWLGSVAGSVGDAIGSAVGGVVSSVSAAWGNFTTSVSSFTAQAGSFLNGVSSGFNLNAIGSGVTAFFQDPVGWYWNHATDIAAWAGVVAMLTWFIPGLDFLTVPIAVICFAASFGATWHDVATGDVYAHPEHFLLDASGMVFGAGFLIEAYRAARIAGAARFLSDAGDIRGGVEVWNSGFEIRQFQEDFDTFGNLQGLVGVADFAYDNQGKLQALWNAI